MIYDISVLIPTFNDTVTSLVRSLSSQLSILDIDYEIIVGDDGSTNAEVKSLNSSIQLIDNVRLIEFPENRGRSVVRNNLVREAKYNHIIFLDADMLIHNNTFVESYLKCDNSDIVYGGYDLPERSSELSSNLRYRYEDNCRHKHTVEKRKNKPYHDFHTSNFFAKKSILLEIPFDESFRQYGYEDVFWGKQICRHGYRIDHIDNGALFANFEDNKSFVKKTEEGLRTLKKHEDLLDGYSRIIDLAKMTDKWHISNIIGWIYKKTKRYLLKNLSGTRPSLFCFHLYRLGYYLSLR